MEEKEAKVREIQKDNIIAKSKVRRQAWLGHAACQQQLGERCQC